MPDITLRFGGYQTEASVHTRALRLMAAALTRHAPETAVAVTPSVTQDGYKAADVLTLVAEGKMDVCYFMSSYLDAARVPALRALDLPFLIADRQGLYEKLDGAFGARLAADIAAGTPYRVLGYWDNGVRHMSNRLRPLRTPTDCAGLKMRTTASPLHQEIFSAFGFVPMAIDPSELGEACATGKVDAQENPLTNLLQFGIDRHHRHVSLTGHFHSSALLLVNRERFDALSPAMQEALQGAAREATHAQREFAIAEDARCIEILKAQGTEIVPPEDIDFPAFKAAARPIMERETQAIGRDVMAALEA